MNERVYNFAAGPSVMPEEALRRAQEEIFSYHGSGMSVMEMSHRSPVFAEIFTGTQEKLRKVLSIPDTHEILFLQGGATLQFAAIPMNLSCGKTTDYAVTGNFLKKAAKEAEKYCTVHTAASTVPDFKRIPRQEELAFSEDAAYFYYCANNTVYGTEWQYVPEAPSPLVCDMSSDILSQPVDISKYGLIYAGAQKNMAPAGLTVVIVDKSLAGKELPFTPQVMSYQTMIQSGSMLNTPPCWCIYMLGLTLDWIIETGGVEAMQQRKRTRAGKLYDLLDNSSLYIPHADRDSRSDMNITFRTASAETDADFVREATAKGLVNQLFFYM